MKKWASTTGGAPSRSNSPSSPSVVRSGEGSDMRKIVFQMMTTLNGRIVEPTAWVHQVGEDQLREIDRIYATYDTVLVGRTTYEEMAGYWPGALSGGAGGETNRSMARRMNAYK